MEVKELEKRIVELEKALEDLSKRYETHLHKTISRSGGFYSGTPENVTRDIGAYYR